MEIIIIYIALIGLAYWQKSTSLNLLSGILSIGFGIYWIQAEGATDFINVVIAIVTILIGLHLWIKTALAFLGGRNE